MPKAIRYRKGGTLGTRRGRRNPLQKMRYNRMTRGFLTNPYSGIHRFRRTVNIAGETGTSRANNITVSAANTHFLMGGTSAAQYTLSYGQLTYYMAIANLPNLSEFTNLFDSYRINSVTLKFIPYATATMDPTAFGASNCIMHWVKDFDDVTLPASGETGIAALEQYPGYRRQNMNASSKGITVKIRPRAATSLYQGAFTAYAQASRNTWINCANPDVQHYGFKACFELYNGTTTGVNTVFPFRVEATYDLSFKGVR